MLTNSRSVMLMMSFAAGTFAAGASSKPRHLMLAQPSQGIPNNPLPLIIYPEVVPEEVEQGEQGESGQQWEPGEQAEQNDEGIEEHRRDLAQWFRTEFGRHGWPVSWHGPIYPYTHYHPNTHELLGITSGWAEILFGGESGRMVTVYAGDAILIPAGVGHQQISASEDFMAVGAYPPGIKPKTLGDEQALLEQSMLEIKRVAIPATDPITGGEGALTEVWHQQAH
ncbi:cupin domain-containing protein [Erwinia sorbitola]|uniref:Cupin domain-containing protein n=1 Tax=Erwinia sorbitola TaxID=2681984 RepID=A0A6I6EEF1_9GAMM|nr:cupin domain-containing protein [Erwinia sorbitola]MTD27721.1 cupin domain-containing protein [Erwinia sorbitola]QGU86275.1 cupin domain-containing protein [Erwinia sorbitola]